MTAIVYAVGFVITVISTLLLMAEFSLTVGNVISAIAFALGWPLSVPAFFFVYVVDRYADVVLWRKK